VRKLKRCYGAEAVLASHIAGYLRVHHCGPSRLRLDSPDPIIGEYSRARGDGWMRP
jgi:hypothetical protein